MKVPKKAIARTLSAIAVAVSAVVALSACSREAQQGFLAGSPGTTDHWDMVAGMWKTSWIVLLCVGVIVWGLIIFCVIVYRRRKGDTGYPVQLRYNMPIEILYTAVPLILVLGFFAVTARDQAVLEARAEPTDTSVLRVEAIGQQWTWQFNYTADNAHERPGEQAHDAGKKSFDESTLPTLWLPANQRVEITLKSRDVAHSFWVPAFLYKKDTIPGRTNYWTFTPQKIGVYKGKCAELCGEYHSQMLFNVKVVTPAEYRSHIATLKSDGLTGLLGDSLNRNQNVPGNSAPASSETTE